MEYVMATLIAPFFLGSAFESEGKRFTSSFTDSVTSQDLQEDIPNYGSALYEIATDYLPYHDLSAEERAQKFQAKMFPDLAKQLTLKALILRDWDGDYTNAEDILKNINTACMHLWTSQPMIMPD
jgi:hypothetical protein